MSAFENLKGKLREIFQLDRNDLDFGLYRIMNLKSEEVTKFIEEDLLPQVKEGLASYASGDSANLNEELEKTVAQLRSVGLTDEMINSAPKVVELREKLKDVYSPEKIENEIYSDLYNFFKRYYSEGDFMSLRRYKEGVYALPYEGEEVKLHWANADQYYIKSSETLSNYTFKIRDRKIRFEVVDATTEQNNNKDDKNRRFRLFTGSDEEGAVNPVTITAEEIVVRFTYLANDDRTSQKDINAEICEQLLENPLLMEFAEDLKRRIASVSLSFLQKHINNFTAKNTFDYFIHKDLRGFLNRELDFFIKNEIMHLDDIENESAVKVEQYLGKIKVLRAVAHKIIDFLASVENFQKKLWLKKKFVLETNYCVTLDRVSEELYSEIIKNKTQHDEWVKLFAIDEIKGEELGSVPYSNPLTVEFLKANPFLVLDTQFFSTEFKYKLLSSIDNLEENTNGLLIHSENFQALNCLSEKYKNKIRTIYIDPPYNAPKSTVPYKNNFKHSAWLSLMENRLIKSIPLQTHDASIIVAIDKWEENSLQRLLRENFGNHDIVSVAIEHNKKGVQGDHFSFSSEYAVFCVSNNLKKLKEKNRKESDWEYSSFRNWGGESLRSDAANCFYPVYVDNKKNILGFGDVCEDSYHPSSANQRIEFNTVKDLKGVDKTRFPVIAIYPIDDDGVERKWRYARQTVEKIRNIIRVKSDKTGGLSIEIPKISDPFKTLWSDPIYNAGDNGTTIITGMGLKFDNPKSYYTVDDCVYAVSSNNDIVLDFFAGSGTTAHCVIERNKIGSNMKYILCEMGTYFDTVTKPRVEKVIYSNASIKDWENGKPKSRKGSSHMFKYVRLESYEDCLDNLKFDRTKGQDDWLDNNPSAREDYMIKYMMDLETKDSILDIKKFETPFDYQINITRDGEVKQVNVDLVETFNFLIGLNVDHIEMLRDVLVVEGTTRAGEKTLVLWRNVNQIDNDALDAWFKKCKYSTADSEFDVIYVNGDNNLENLRRDDQTWKVRLTEAEFQKRMFDVQDVK